MSNSGLTSGFLGENKGGVIGGSPLTDVSSATNLAVSSPITLTGDTIGITTTDITTLGTLTTLTVDNVIINGTTIGHTSDTDLITLTADTVTVAGAVNATTVGGTLSTAAQTNITSLGTLSALTVDNIGINGSNIGHTSDTDLITLAEDTVTVAGAMNATTVGGTLSTAAQTNVTSLGTLTTLTVDNIAIDGTTIGHTSDTDLLSLASAELTVNGNINVTGDILMADEGWIGQDSGEKIIFDTNGNHIQFQTGKVDFVLGSMRAEFNTTGLKIGDYVYADSTDGVHLEFGSPNAHIVCSDTDGILTFDCATHFEQNITVAEDTEISIGGDTEKITFNGGSSRIDIGAGQVFIGSGGGNGYLASIGDNNTWIRYQADQISIRAGGTDYLDITTSGVNFGDNTVSRPKLKDYSETVNVIGTITGNTAVNFANGNVQTVTGNGDCEFTFTNPPASGTAGTVTLIITNGGANATTWHSSVKWPGDSAPALTSSGVDIVSFVTIDAGTNIYGFVGGIAFA
jgi:hypothetical protein